MHISWARLASFCHLGFISDPLINLFHVNSAGISSYLFKENQKQYITKSSIRCSHVCGYNLFPTKCPLLIKFANSLDPDQARHFVGPDLDPICLTLRWYSWQIFSKKFIFKNQQTTKKQEKFPRGQRVWDQRLCVYTLGVTYRKPKGKPWCW